MAVNVVELVAERVGIDPAKNTQFAAYIQKEIDAEVKSQGWTPAQQADERRQVYLSWVITETVCGALIAGTANVVQSLEEGDQKVTFGDQVKSWKAIMELAASKKQQLAPQIEPDDQVDPGERRYSPKPEIRGWMD